MTARLLAIAVAIEAAIVLTLLMAQVAYAIAGRRRRRTAARCDVARSRLIEAVVTDRVSSDVIASLDSLRPRVRDAVLCQVAVEVRSESDPVFSDLAAAVGSDERIHRDLRSRRWWVRRSAARRAQALGVARTEIVTMLQDPDARVRATAATWLGTVPVASAAKVVVPLLGDDDGRVRSAAMTALHALGSAAQEALIDGLDTTDLQQLDATLRVAAAIGDPIVAEAIRPLVAHPEPLIQARAVRALHPVLSDDDVPLVCDLLDHEDPRVRAAAAEVAGRARLQGAAGAVARGMDSPDGGTRGAAIVALEGLGPTGQLLLRRALRPRAVPGD